MILTKEQIELLTKSPSDPCCDPLEVSLFEAIPHEGKYVVRVAEEDIPYSCGVECCGIEEYALIVVDSATMDKVMSLST